MSDRTDDTNAVEQVAMGTWARYPAADATVRAVTIAGDRAEVFIEVAGGYPDYVYCVRHDGGWGEVLSGNGPCHRWWDPSLYGWGDLPW